MGLSLSFGNIYEIVLFLGSLSLNGSALTSKISNVGSFLFFEPLFGENGELDLTLEGDPLGYLA